VEGRLPINGVKREKADILDGFPVFNGSGQRE
jgi:hypothetical protein